MSAWNRWLAGWIDIACGACAVLSLGMWRPSWDFIYIASITRAALRKSIAAAKEAR